MNAHVPHPSLHEHVVIYLDACARAGTRARDILILITVATVLLFGALWNARGGSWTNERISMDERVLALDSVRKACLAQGTSDSECAKEPSWSLSPAEIAAAEAYADLRPTLKDHPEGVAVALDRLRQLQIEDIFYLRIPFFGIVVDVNDAGFLAGGAYVVLLVWLRLSLWRELSNVQVTFREATEHDCLRFCYEALSMQQVLSIPPTLTGKHRKDSWSVIVPTLQVLPLLMQAAFFAFDLRTFRLGWTLSPFDTVFELAVSTLCLILVALLVWRCIGLSGEIGAEWRRAAKEIIGSEPNA